jgi:hypothetical protein
VRREKRRERKKERGWKGDDRLGLEISGGENLHWKVSSSSGDGVFNDLGAVIRESLAALEEGGRDERRDSGRKSTLCMGIPRSWARKETSRGLRRWTEDSHPLWLRIRRGKDREGIEEQEDLERMRCLPLRY